MAKKVQKQLTLEELIPLYGQEKEILDKYKKSADSVNKQIKELMVAGGYDEKEVGGYIAKYSVSYSESYDTEKLIEYIHKHKDLESCIKTKEYVDETILEDLIYKGKLSKTEVAALDKFRVTKETPRLTVKKVGD